MFLRTTHLDELPQLFNVMTGSMGLVGPRPLEAADHFALRNSAQRESLLPGMTGPWQLERAHKHDYSKMEALDGQLVENTTLWLRLTLLMRTVSFVLRRNG